MLFMQIKKQSRSNADTNLVFMLIIVMLPVRRENISKRQIILTIKQKLKFQLKL